MGSELAFEPLRREPEAFRRSNAQSGRDNREEDLGGDTALRMSHLYGLHRGQCLWHLCLRLRYFRGGSDRGEEDNDGILYGGRLALASARLNGMHRFHAVLTVGGSMPRSQVRLRACCGCR